MTVIINKSVHLEMTKGQSITRQAKFFLSCRELALVFLKSTLFKMVVHNICKIYHNIGKGLNGSYRYSTRCNPAVKNLQQSLQKQNLALLCP